MDFREKVALILLAVILYKTVCSKCMPQCLKDSPFERYINKHKYSPNIPTTHEKGRKSPKFQDNLIKQNKLYSKLSPLDVSDSFINNLKREKRMKRKLERAKKIYARDNDEKFTIPASFHNPGTPFYLSEVGLFPEVQYPLTASDTWTTNYWNPLPSNNHDRFFKKDAYFTDSKKPSTDSFHIFKQSPTAINNKKLPAIVKKSENNKISSGAKNNKIVRQTTASQGQKKSVDSFEPKDDNEIEKYLMKTPKLTEKKKTLSVTYEKIRQSKNKQDKDSNKGFNQTISNNKSNKTHTNLKNKMRKDKKTNGSVITINKTVPQEKMSKLTEQKYTTKDENLENINVEKSFSPKTKNTTEKKSVSKKSMSSIAEVTSHFSKLITKLEQLSDKHKITSTTTTNQLISLSPTNETSKSVSQEEKQETKVTTQNNPTKILQVETKMSKENMKAGDELLNLLQISDKNMSDEGAQMTLKTSEEESDLPFSFTDYVVRNQLLDVLSDPKLSISSLRNGIFKILEEIDSKSVEELDETPFAGINESTHMLPLVDDGSNADSLKSWLPGNIISYLDTQNTPGENFNEAILTCTTTADSSSEVIFKNDISDGKPVDTRHSDNVCEDDSYVPDDFVTGSLAENLRNVIADPSSSNSLIEDLSEIIRLLTVWNSHIDDSGESVHQTTEIDTIDGSVPIKTELSSDGVPKTAATDHSYEFISDSDMIDHSIIDETEYLCDIDKFNVTSHLKKDVIDCATEDIFNYNETDHSIEDVTSYSCENNHELNETDYSRYESVNYSCKNNYTQCSNENSDADHTCEDILNPNAKDHFDEDVANYSNYPCEDIYKYTEIVPSNENMAGTREDILKHNVSEGEITNDSIDDICSFNLTDLSKEDQTENLCEDVQKLNSCEGVISDSCEDDREANVTDDSNENKSEYSNKDIHKPNTTVYSCEDTADCLYEDNSKSNATNSSNEDNYSCKRIGEHYARCFSSEIVPNDSCEDKSSNGTVADTCYHISNPEVTDYSNEDTNSLKVKVICSESVNDNSYEEIYKLNVTDQSHENKTEYSCENIYKHNAHYSSEDTNDGSCENFFKFNETKYTNLADTHEDITKPYVNDYSNEGVIDNSYENISTANVTDYYSNEDENKNSQEGIQQPNAAVYSCEDVTDCSNQDISSNATCFSNEKVTSFSCENIHKSNVTEYSNEDETEFSSEDTYTPKSIVNINDGLIDYSYEVIGKRNVTDHSNKTLADYSCEDVGSLVMNNSSEVTNISYSDNSKLKSNVTNEILNDFSNDDIAISNLIKRKVKNMAKLNMLEHNTEHTEKHNITDYFSANIPDYSSNDLFKPNTTNYLSEMLPNALENIPKANEERTKDSKERISESSGTNYLNENFEIVSDSPTIYHIPFEKNTNDKFSTIAIEVDDQTVNDKVTEDSICTSNINLSDITPLSASPSFTYEVNEEIPESELVTIEKLDKITSTETLTDKEIISNDTVDYLPVFTFDDVFQSLSDDSETPIAFVSTCLPSFDENILKLYNETETEMNENCLPTIPNRDTKTYDEVCPVTGNESSEDQCFMIDDSANFNNLRSFLNDSENSQSPFTNNISELFGDKENPDFYDFILHPKEYKYSETSENNDTRELNSDIILDFTDYTVLPEDTTFSEYNEENYIETLATTVNPFDQYDDVSEQNEESNVSDGSSKSNQNIHNVGNRYVTQDTTFEPNREDKSSTDYTSLPEDPKLTKYFDDNFEEEHDFRPLYERNVKPLLHRDFVQHHQR